MNRLALTLLALLAWAASPLQGKVIEVPGQVKTIQAAIDAAADGDTVLVSPGIYREELKIEGKNITLASTFHTTGDRRHIATTVVDAGGSTNKGGGIALAIAAGVGPGTRIVGLTLRGGDHGILNRGHIAVLDNRLTGNRDALSFERGKAEVRRNLFEKNADDGIDIDQASAAVIENNVIRRNGDDGIELRLHKHSGEMLEIVVRGNLIAHNEEDGLQLIDYPDKSQRTVRIERNVFLANAMAGVGSMADGNSKENYAGAELLEPVFLLNNTIVGHHYGITGGQNMVLLNNVVINCRKTALAHIGGDSAASHNLLWSNGRDLEECDIEQDTLVRADPLCDADGRPRAGSPCIDGGAATIDYAGETLTLPAETYAGKSPELGAFEFEMRAAAAMQGQWLKDR